MNKSLNTKGRILVIDDLQSWANNFVEILKRIGETREVKIFYSLKEFLETMNSSQQFENIDVCISDLELYGSGSKKANDLAGLTDILPHIRKYAPWIPVACISRFFDTDQSILWELSGSDFDFLSPKSMIIWKADKDELRMHSEFNKKKWTEMLEKMQFKRIANITSRSLCEIKASSTKTRTLESDQITTTMFSDLGISKNSFSNAIGLLGIEGSEFFVKALQPGFSGVNVSLVKADGHTNNEPVHACWLIKWGLPIWKLEEEANAHRRIFCRGLDRSLQIPQLHSHTIVWDGIGYIAYAFEKDAQVALDVAKNNIELLSESLCTITQGLYDEARRKTVLGETELTKWVGLSAGEVQNILAGDESFEVSWSLLHGDLHLRNIFIRGKLPTLIDFARSDFGPIVIDAAKIIIDILVWAPPSNLPIALTEEAIADSGLAPILDAFKPHLKEKDDIKFLNVALCAIAHKYMSYSDVEEDAKNRLRNLLK